MLNGERSIVLIIHDVRSAHNAGSLLRTADGLGIDEVLFSGITPYPPVKDDTRLPHLAAKAGRAVTKTSLGSEKTVNWRRTAGLPAEIESLASGGYLVAALEQTPSAKDITAFKPPDKIALIVGNEVDGIGEDILDLCGIHLMIPMLGSKESFNAAVAGAMALFRLRYG